MYHNLFANNIWKYRNWPFVDSEKLCLQNKQQQYKNHIIIHPVTQQLKLMHQSLGWGENLLV